MNPESKKCTKCGKIKFLDQFNKQKPGKLGRYCQCKECTRKRDKEKYHNDPKRRARMLEYHQFWNKTNPEKVSKQRRKRLLKDNYGLTLEQYDRMFEQQNGVCAICNKIDLSGRRLAVDHDHKTGKIRGLLCIACNSKLGIIEDESFIKAAKKYVESYPDICS